VREKKGVQEREDMPKSSAVRKAKCKRKREEGRTSNKGKNPLRNSSRRGDHQIEAKKKIKARKWIRK
jgi:hypothetical protein